MLPTSKGTFAHEDFCGHKGLIGPGDLQWMTAGKGIVHSEMPHSGGVCLFVTTRTSHRAQTAHGLQLWVNLAAKDKMSEPRYQELKADQIPHVTQDGVTAIIIAGEAFGVHSPVYTLNPTYYLHFIMQPNTKLQQKVPPFAPRTLLTPRRSRRTTTRSSTCWRGRRTLARPTRAARPTTRCACVTQNAT